MKLNAKIQSNTVSHFCRLSLLFLFFITSCESKEKNDSQLGNKETIQNFFNNAKFLEGKTFISRSGNRLGMDSDTEIFFQSDQKVTLMESGLDSVKYEGIFSIDGKTGEIELKLPKYEKVWPKMKLKVRDGLAFIFRSDGQTYMTPELKDAKEFQGYWPFAEQAPK